MARGNHCEFVIAFGGGSVIDTGKAVSALLGNEGELLDYLEVVGKGQPLENPTKRYIAIPTTAGTGSEVTKNAVISVPEKKVKVSIRSDFMLPDIALIDPQFTFELPTKSLLLPEWTHLSRWLNHMCAMHRIRWSICFARMPFPAQPTFLSKLLSMDEIKKPALIMSWVSLMGGLSLANAKFGAVHGFAGPIGGMFDAPHGAICAALMPAVMKVNCELLETKGGNEDTLKQLPRNCWLGYWK